MLASFDIMFIRLDQNTSSLAIHTLFLDSPDKRVIKRHYIQCNLAIKSSRLQTLRAGSASLAIHTLFLDSPDTLVIKRLYTCNLTIKSSGLQTRQIRLSDGMSTPLTNPFCINLFIYAYQGNIFFFFKKKKKK